MGGVGSGVGLGLGGLGPGLGEGVGGVGIVEPTPVKKVFMVAIDCANVGFVTMVPIVSCTSLWADPGTELMVGIARDWNTVPTIFFTIPLNKGF